MATAGHVDHGKSTLVRALTGMEPDRWAEEQRRGMTIDLGFAWTQLPSGVTAAFVDVPGHHRFITNMLAGIGPVPAALLVIAADEGWCRQTEEHVAALTALNVRHGLLAVTRTDLADPETAVAEARDRLAGTPLENIEAVAVHAPSGRGIDRLRTALDRLVHSLPAADTEGPTRLWIDRAFTVRGAGTVVTGTLATGRIERGDELVLAPSGTQVRIRGLQSLKETVTGAGAVARLAVNLRGTALENVARGHALIGPGEWAQVSRIDVRLHHVREIRTHHLVLHLGSAAVPARLRPLGRETGRLTLAQPLPLHVGERVLLRDPGMHRIVAGATILDTRPTPLRRRGAATARAVELSSLPQAPDCARYMRLHHCARRSDLLEAGLLRPGVEPPSTTRRVGDWVIHNSLWESWRTELMRVVDAWAERHPLAPGMPRAAAARMVGLPDSRLLGPLIGATVLVSDATGVRRPGSGGALPEAVLSAVGKVRERLESAPFAPPSVPELQALGLTRKHLSAAEQNGLLLRITDDVCLLPDAARTAVSRLAALPQPFTVSQGRACLGTSRRVAVPLFEYLDRLGLTVRTNAQERRLRTGGPTAFGPDGSDR
ncbi:selenocysteine-specific translation elongation factor [Streptomyces sp. NPDC088252]|uniref:selenocysteine-specific translation elongation factor n=1 Tax=unclassified Streptomyces TaxID=2593676 RepID=UPI00343D14BA